MSQQRQNGPGATVHGEDSPKSLVYMGFRNVKGSGSVTANPLNGDVTSIT
jgi:hypothetical protein